MGRLAGLSGSDVRRAAERTGWVYERTRGDHMVFRKEGVDLNLSIPNHRELAEGLLRRLIAIMGLSVDEFLRLAKK